MYEKFNKDSPKSDRKSGSKKHCHTETERNEERKKSGIIYRGILEGRREKMRKIKQMGTISEESEDGLIAMLC
jgi:hypothetical protein